MPVLCHVSPEQGLAYAQLTGSIFGNDIIEGIENLLMDRAWRPHLVSAWDARGVDELVITPTDVDNFASFIRDIALLIGPTRTAIIVSRDLVFMAATLYAETMMEIIADHNVSVFWRLDEALAWLGISEDATRVSGGVRA